jgi:type I restriction enzyme S subunit
MYNESDLGPIPKSWEIKSLANLLENIPHPMRSGPFGSALLKSELVDSGIPLLGIDNVHHEFFSRQYIRFVSKDKFNELQKYAVRPNDVMITIMGTVGRCCIVPKDIGLALSSKHVWTMTIDQRVYLPELICWQLNYAPWILSQFEKGAQGGVMDAISSSTLRKLKLAVPPMDEQIPMAEKYLSMQATLQTEQEVLSKYKLLKTGLMQDLLTGKVRVKVDQPTESDQDVGVHQS